MFLRGSMEQRGCMRPAAAAAPKEEEGGGRDSAAWKDAPVITPLPLDFTAAADAGHSRWRCGCFSPTSSLLPGKSRRLRSELRPEVNTSADRAIVWTCVCAGHVS